MSISYKLKQRALGHLERDNGGSRSSRYQRRAHSDTALSAVEETALSMDSAPPPVRVNPYTIPQKMQQRLDDPKPREQAWEDEVEWKPKKRPRRPVPSQIEVFEPPNPEDQGRLCMVLHDVLSHEECRELIQHAEEQGLAHRRSLRASIDQEDCCGVGDRVYRAIESRLPLSYRRGKPSRLGRIRFLRYMMAGSYEPHQDTAAVDSESMQRSLCTVMVYLNSAGLPDEEDESVVGAVKGGATVMCPGPGVDPMRRVSVSPREGSVLVFDHELVHCGEVRPNPNHSNARVRLGSNVSLTLMPSYSLEVIDAGRKYVIRTDLMFCMHGEPGG